VLGLLDALSSINDFSGLGRELGLGLVLRKRKTQRREEENRDKEDKNEKQEGKSQKRDIRPRRKRNKTEQR
jgi:hypothetical protein